MGSSRSRSKRGAGTVRSGITGPPSRPTDRPTSDLPAPSWTHEPVPGSLRQTGRIVTARLSLADYLWLKDHRFQPGEILRSFVEIHRGDRTVKQLEKEEKAAETRLVALRSARQLTLDQLTGTKAQLARQELVAARIRTLREEFELAGRTRFGHRSENRAWLKARTDPDPLLRRIPPLELLDQLLQERT